MWSKPSAVRNVFTAAILACLVYPASLWGSGIVFLSGDDSDDAGHCQGTACGGLYPAIFKYCIENSQSPGVGIVAIGVNPGNATTAIHSWNNPANGGPGAPLTILTDDEDIRTFEPSNFKMVYIPSVSGHTSGGITTAQLDALNTRQTSLVVFINNIKGALVALTEAGASNGYGWLPIPIETADQQHIQVCPTTDLTDDLSPASTCANLSHCCYHNIFTGPPGFLGLKTLVVSNDAPLGQVLMIGGNDIQFAPQGKLTPEVSTVVVRESVQLSCTVTEGDEPFPPIPDVPVTLEVLTGPNEGATAVGVTDAKGVALLTYFGSDQPGTDEVESSFIDPEGGFLVKSNVVLVFWQADCNENGEADSDDVANGTSPDCNGNVVPDECDLAQQNSVDCQDNGVPDECDIADGTEPDCDANTVPDICDLTDGLVRDCNTNVVPDSCDIASGTSSDCNSNAAPDECDLFALYSSESASLSPVGAGSPQSFLMADPPEALTDVTLTFTSIADLGDNNEAIEVTINGSFAGMLFAGTGSQCPVLPDQETLVIPAADYNNLVLGGDAAIVMTATDFVDAGICGPNEFIQVKVEYGTGNDCNGNGSPDACDLPDCNHNDLPDTCDLDAGTSSDTDGDGLPDECEGLACCESPALCDGDANGDGTVDPLDVGAVAARFGLDATDPDLCSFDMNCDEEIDPLDSGYIFARFSVCDTPPVCPAGCQHVVCPGEGDCCIATALPGCSDEACCAAVCGSDPFCCNVLWDEVCAAEAVETCDVCGGGGEGEGEGEGEPPVCGPGSGDCCTVHDTPGCDDEECCQTVCIQDNFCCEVQWDIVCANSAAADCGLCLP